VLNGDLGYAQILGQRFAAEVPTQINFAFDSAQLDESARRILLRQAAWIKQFPEARSRVYGHTDAVGSQAYNQALGQRRANAAVAFLTQ
ncbi:OmpA family protein, partial [Opacimonas viscosa]